MDIQCYRGETAQWTVTISLDGTPFNLTGSTVRMDVSRNPASPILFQKSSASSGVTIAAQSGGTLGQATIQLAATDTGMVSNQDTVLSYFLWVTTISGLDRVALQGQLTVKASA